MGNLTKEQFIEKHRSLVIRCVNEYLDSHIYDYPYFTKTREYTTTKHMPQLLAFVYKNFPIETYKKFHDKAAPFEPYLDVDDSLEKEAFKRKMAKLATDVRDNKANLIEILDSGITDISQYVYMVKLLTYEYRMLSPSIFMNNYDYSETIEKYKDGVANSTVEFADITPQLEQAMKETLESRNLSANSVTLTAAHAYCKRKLQSAKTR